MRAAPPILAVASGRKPRARAAKIPEPKEQVLHLDVAKLLKDHCLPDWFYCHVPNGEHRDIRTAAKLKAMGVRRGVADFLFIAPDGSLRCLELKRAGGKLTDDQEAFQLICIKRGIPYVVASTIDHVLATFDFWGCLRIKIPQR